MPDRRKPAWPAGVPSVNGRRRALDSDGAPGDDVCGDDREDGMGGIGTERREVEFEPLPDDAPPVEQPAPVEEPAPEPVPA